jgi:pimeloyl-ACP methyl ester carboxylesterase
MTIYLLPGLGADHRLFDGLSIPGHRFVYINLPIPRSDESMASYAMEISKQIDTSEKFVVIGVSLGGMIACELATILNPHKVVLISSARCNREIPNLYKLQARTGIVRVIPAWLLKYSAILLQGLYEPDGWKVRKIFRSMFRVKSAIYFKRTVNLIVNWDRTEINPDIIHIHGTGDRTLPFSLVKPHHVIEGGSHIMVYTRAKEINQILGQVLAS